MKNEIHKISSILTIYSIVSLSRCDVNMYVSKHLTQTIYSGFFLCLSLWRTKFMGRASILTIFSGLSLSSYDLKIYGPKHLTYTIWSWIFRYELRNSFREPQYWKYILEFCLPLWYELYETKHSTQAIYSSISLSHFMILTFHEYT